MKLRERVEKMSQGPSVFFFGKIFLFSYGFLLACVLMCSLASISYVVTMHVRLVARYIGDFLAIYGRSAGRERERH